MSLGDLHLTDVALSQEATFPGMAYFACSGPPAKHCGDCENWDKKSRPIGRCVKYQRLTGRLGHAVPRLASSCKYFEPLDVRLP